MTVIGRVGGSALAVRGQLEIPVAELREARRQRPGDLTSMSTLSGREITVTEHRAPLLASSGAGMETVIDHRDGPRDECGVFGIYAPDHDVARLAYFALFALQHRGQESAGIATAQRGGTSMAHARSGLVAQVFDEHTLRSLVGDLAIGHVRYSTTGSSEWENSQPIVRDDHRALALAHNGNLINAVELHSELRGRGVPFRSTSDSEIIAALLATHPAERIEDAVADVLPRLKGAFSTVVDDRGRGGRVPRPARAAPAGAGHDRATATASPASRARSTSSAPSTCARSQPGEIVTLTERGIETRLVVAVRAQGVLRVRVHLLRPPGLEDGGDGAAGRPAPGWARSCGARPPSRPTS